MTQPESDTPKPYVLTEQRITELLARGDTRHEWHWFEVQNQEFQAILTAAKQSQSYEALARNLARVLLATPASCSCCVSEFAHEPQCDIVVRQEALNDANKVLGEI